MRGVMVDPSQRKKRELHTGPPCPHYPHKFKTEAAHKAKNESRRRNHQRMKRDLDYRLLALLRTIEHRCNSPKHISYRWYGAKGIRNELTFDMLKFMWKRDAADKMKKPSIDRNHSDQDYTFANCMFRELKANQDRAWIDKRGRAEAISNGMKNAKYQRLGLKRGAPDYSRSMKARRRELAEQAEQVSGKAR